MYDETRMRGTKNTYNIPNNRDRFAHLTEAKNRIICFPLLSINSLLCFRESLIITYLAEKWNFDTRTTGVCLNYKDVVLPV